MPETTLETTHVTEVDMDLDNILGTPGSENIMLPNEEVSKSKTQNLFSSKPVDMSFLDKEEKEKTEIPEGETEEQKIAREAKDTEAKKKEVSTEEVEKTLSIEDPDDEGSAKETKTTGNIAELMNKLVEKKLILPFDDDKSFDEYKLADFEQLLEENMKENERKIREEAPIEFFDALPDQLKYAAKYVADGGTDLKGLFRSLSASEEIKTLDPKKEDDQKQIIRSYLMATRFGTADEIEDEIDGWHDRDELESKALKFKPKLDALQEEVVTVRLQNQETLRLQRERESQKYVDNLYNVLEPGDLNGIKLDKKTQGFLFSGLVEPKYESRSGRGTNLLGHLLEKYQYVEPNHSLIAEVLWLLADPDTYKAKIQENGKKETTQKHVRMLKTEEANKLASTTNQDNIQAKPNKEKLAKPSANFFKR